MHDTYPVTITLPRGYGCQPDGLRYGWLFDELQFEVRALSRGELTRLRRRHVDGCEFEEAVLAAAVVEHPTHFLGRPWDWQLIYAGVASLVADEILSLSGTRGPHPLITERVNAYLSSPDSRGDILILSAGFNLRPDEVRELDPETWQASLELAILKLRTMGMADFVDAILEPGKAKKPRLPLPGGPPGSQPAPQRGKSFQQTEQAMLFTAD